MTATQPRRRSSRAVALTKRLILLCLNKGGCSKSRLAAIVAELLLARGGKPPLLLDGDASNQSLSRYYWELVERFATHSAGAYALDVVVSKFLPRGNDVVLCDLPADSLTAFQSMNYDFIAGAAEYGYRITILAPVFPWPEVIADIGGLVRHFDPEIAARFFDESIPGPIEQLPKMEPRVDYVLARNRNAPGFEDDSDFLSWDKSVERQLALYARSVEVVIPVLRARIQEQIGTHALRFGEAESWSGPEIDPEEVSRLAKLPERLRPRIGEDGPGFGFPDRSRMAAWNDAVYAAFHAPGVAAKLGLA